MRVDRLIARPVLIMLLVPAGVVAVGVGAAHAVSCGYYGDVPEVGSIDADNSPDVASSVAHDQVVDVHLSAVGAQHVDISDFAGSLQQANFGASLASMDLNHDGCSELIVGAPSIYGTYPSAVDILTGSPTGLSSTGITVLHPPVASNDWGASVAVASRGADATDASDLWVGAPDRTVDGLADAGAVDHYVVAADGTPTFVDTVTAGTAGVGGTVHAGARFGQVLSAWTDDVFIGAPDDTVSGQVGAGSATLVTVSTTTNHVTSGHYWTQNSPGVPGASEAGDHFGAAVSNAGDVQLVGVPGEDLGTSTDAGMVQFFVGGAPSSALSQDSAGVPGIVEAGDEFGASVALGVWLTCQESSDAAIGSPGEDVGSIKNAGSVTLVTVPGGGNGPCADRLLTQGASGGLGGAAEAGDVVGASLSVLRGRDDFDEDDRDTLVVGVPGEDSGSIVNSGLVETYSLGSHRSFTYSAGTYQSTSYGRVLVNPGGGPEFSPPDN